MRRLNKKALIFVIFIDIIVIITLIAALAVLSQKQSKFEKELGSRQYELITSYQEAEKALFFIDQSAKYSAYQSIYDLGKKGGFYSQPECGTYQDYNLWQSKDKQCYPKDLASIKLTLVSFFNLNLNKYLPNYPDIPIPRDNYDYLVNQSDSLKIIGIATKNLEFNVYSTTGLQPLTGRYSIKPSFKQEIDYNLSDYLSIKEKAEQLSRECGNKADKDVEKCVEEKINAFTDKLKWEIDCDKGAERAFYNIVEAYKQTANTEGNDFFAPVDLEEDIIFKDQSYKIKLTQNGIGTVFELIQPDLGLKETVNDLVANYLAPTQFSTDSAKWEQPDEIIFELNYDGNGKLKSSKAEGRKIDNAKQSFFLYKFPKIGLGAVSKVGFVDMGTFYSPGYNIAYDLKLLPRRTVKLCVKKEIDTGKYQQLLVYDNTNKKTEYKDAIIKFALYISDLPPEPVEGLELQDKKKAENSVIIKWARNKEGDIKQYNLYYKEQEFENDPADPGFKKIDGAQEKIILDMAATALDRIGVPDAGRLETMDLTPNKNYKYIANKGLTDEKEMELQPKTIYYIKSEDKYLYILNDLEDNKKYFFAVTAADEGSNEGKIKETKDAMPVDDLAPKKPDSLNAIEENSKNYLTFNAPAKNEDDTNLKAGEQLNVKAYYKQNACDDISKGLEFNDAAINYLPSADAKIELPSLQKQDAQGNNVNYCFAVLIMDKTGNPKENIDDYLTKAGPIALP